MTHESLLSMPKFNPFDPLLFLKKLRDVGVSEEQAETSAEGLSELIKSDLATKDDLMVFEHAIKDDLVILGQNLNKLEFKLEKFEAEITNKISNLDARFNQFEIYVKQEFVTQKNYFIDAKFEEIQSSINVLSERVKELVMSMKDIKQAIENISFQLLVKLGFLMAALMTLFFGCMMVFIKL